MSWVVDDSEDEDNFDASLKPQEAPVQSHSVISEFSAHEIVLPESNQTSPISNFTTLDNGVHRPDTTTDGIVVASTSVPTAAGAEPAPVKPKRPKPRPAYKGHLGGSDSIEQSTSAASAIANAINQIGPGSSHEPIVDATFSLDIAERAKTRKRNTTGSSAKTPISSKDAGSIIVEGSSKDIIIAISSDGECEPSPSRVDFTTQSRRQEQARSSQASSKISHIPASNAPTLLLHSDSSSAIRITRAPSSLFDQQHQNPGSTPPSSPFQPRKPKRRLLDEDYTFFDDGISADHGTRYLPELAKKDGEPSTKKQKRTKEKKPREGKSKTTVEGDAVTATKASTKKRAEKSKSASEQPEFKSKEFVDDSDDGEEDDLLLRPSDHCKKSETTSSSVPRTSYSDPASMAREASVQASINESARPSGLVSVVSTPTTTKTVEHSASIPPFISVSVGPSAGVSEVPCTDAHVSACVSAPPPVLPPSPSMSRMSEVDRSSPVKKRKKKRKDAASVETGREALVSFNMDIDLGVPAEQSHTGQSEVPIEEPTKKKAGRPKKKKKTEVQSSTVDETRVQGASSSSALLLPPNGAESAEQSISMSTSKETQQQKKRPKSKKHGTIVSSDEDEVEGNPSKVMDNVDPVGVEVDKESRGDDKENEPLPSPKNQPAQGVSTPHPPTTHHQSPIPDSRLKSRASSTSTSHNPPRRDSMSALIRRVSSKVHSPLNSPSPSSNSHSYSHSPLAKSSRLALSRIAPLHPNRRTPPPAPPRPPPPKKSKKMLELEEKWEMELAESVDGWACLGDEERAALRRAKRDKELGFDD